MYAQSIPISCCFERYKIQRNALMCQLLFQYLWINAVEQAGGYFDHVSLRDSVLLKSSLPM